MENSLGVPYSPIYLLKALCLHVKKCIGPLPVFISAKFRDFTDGHIQPYQEKPTTTAVAAETAKTPSITTETDTEVSKTQSRENNYFTTSSK